MLLSTLAREHRSAASAGRYPRFRVDCGSENEGASHFTPFGQGAGPPGNSSAKLCGMTGALHPAGGRYNWFGWQVEAAR